MKPHHIRIIGGQWRSRQIPVLSEPDLRPTPDRIRETLFNWLRPFIVGARCLDLFAGTGALSFEALSQGASQVVCIEHSKPAVEQLHQTAQSLGAQSLEIIQSDAIIWLENNSHTTMQPFDIVFLDPPYAANLLNPCLSALQNGYLNPAALIYCEHNQPLSPEDLPGIWQILKQKKAGRVYYYLVTFSGW